MQSPATCNHYLPFPDHITMLQVKLVFICFRTIPLILQIIYLKQNTEGDARKLAKNSSNLVPSMLIVHYGFHFCVTFSPLS